MVGKFMIIFFEDYVKKAHSIFFAVRFFGEFVIPFRQSAHPYNACEEHHCCCSQKSTPQYKNQTREENIMKILIAEDDTSLQFCKRTTILWRRSITAETP